MTFWRWVGVIALAGFVFLYVPACGQWLARDCGARSFVLAAVLGKPSWDEFCY